MIGGGLLGKQETTAAMKRLQHQLAVAQEETEATKHQLQTVQQELASCQSHLKGASSAKIELVEVGWRCGCQWSCHVPCVLRYSGEWQRVDALQEELSASQHATLRATREAEARAAELQRWEEDYGELEADKAEHVANLEQEVEEMERLVSELREENERSECSLIERHKKELHHCRRTEAALSLRLAAAQGVLMQSQEDSNHTHRVLCATEAALYAARKAATAAEAEGAEWREQCLRMEAVVADRSAAVDEARTMLQQASASTSMRLAEAQAAWQTAAQAWQQEKTHMATVCFALRRDASMLEDPLTVAVFVSQVASMAREDAACLKSRLTVAEMQVEDMRSRCVVTETVRTPLSVVPW